MKTTLVLLIAIFSLNAQAFEKYYPLEALNKFQDPSISAPELKETIFQVLNQVHIITEDQHDQLSDVCPIKAKCLSQKDNVSYKTARIILFGELHLKKENNQYFLNEVYCNNKIGASAGVGPGKIPNPDAVNCEHTWPQSKFTSQFPAGLQKSDLHHLYPSDMRANSTRSNYPFAEVDGRVVNSNCLDSKIGNAIGSNIKSFEPPLEHKGNVARAIFYFSVRYNMALSSTEKDYLVEWNKIDPVDEEERIRNQKIMDFQGNRNPFIDYPELIERI